mmetsp:Transcript_10281/g.15460  ORF Transcript_10281/g.15460 Transcript_10281/m.15460 type:complete len:117 (-) Transcript_10281:506-856(-)
MMDSNSNSDGNDNNKDNDNGDIEDDDTSIVSGLQLQLQTNTKKQNLVIILQWRIRSMYHLCRFNDAKVFIERMNLTSSTFCNGQVPKWIPLESYFTIYGMYDFLLQEKGRIIDEQQ